MTLEEILPWLFARTTGGVRWGLERTEELLAGAGDPHRHFRALHVGGTNGKGSVAALCDAALRADGGAGRIGLYTSPHLVHFAERIRVDGAPLPDAVIAEAAVRLRPAIERTGATFFEATTAIALLCFREAGVGTAVIEVGLGGRLDATNVITPAACAITNVAMDHTDYLGDTLASIAAEKAGILKPGVPAVTMATGVALEVIRRRAAEVGAPLQSVAQRVRVRDQVLNAVGASVHLESVAWGEQRLEIGLAGGHQVENGLLAMEMLGLLPPGMRPGWEALAHGFASVRWPGRLQVERIAGTTYLFDVAHNPAGVRALAQAIRSLEPGRPRVLVVSILDDKEWREMLPPLVECSEAVILTVPHSAPPSRAWDAGAVAHWLTATGEGRPVRVVPEIGDAVRRAATLAPHGTVIVAGSFHTVGDAMHALGITPA